MSKVSVEKPRPQSQPQAESAADKVKRLEPARKIVGDVMVGCFDYSQESENLAYKKYLDGLVAAQNFNLQDFKRRLEKTAQDFQISGLNITKKLGDEKELSYAESLIESLFYRIVENFGKDGKVTSRELRVNQFSDIKFRKKSFDEGCQKFIELLECSIKKGLEIDDSKIDALKIIEKNVTNFLKEFLADVKLLHQDLSANFVYSIMLAEIKVVRKEVSELQTAKQSGYLNLNVGTDKKLSKVQEEVMGKGFLAKFQTSRDACKEVFSEKLKYLAKVQLAQLEALKSGGIKIALATPSTNQFCARSANKELSESVKNTVFSREQYAALQAVDRARLKAGSQKAGKELAKVDILIQTGGGKTFLAGIIDEIFELGGKSNITLNSLRDQFQETFAILKNRNINLDEVHFYQMVYGEIFPDKEVSKKKSPEMLQEIYDHIRKIRASDRGNLLISWGASASPDVLEIGINRVRDKWESAKDAEAKVGIFKEIADEKKLLQDVKLIWVNYGFSGKVIVALPDSSKFFSALDSAAMAKLSNLLEEDLPAQINDSPGRIQHFNQSLPAGVLQIEGTERENTFNHYRTLRKNFGLAKARIGLLDHQLLKLTHLEEIAKSDFAKDGDLKLQIEKEIKVVQENILDLLRFNAFDRFVFAEEGCKTLDKARTKANSFIKPASEQVAVTLQAAIASVLSAEEKQNPLYDAVNKSLEGARDKTEALKVLYETKKQQRDDLVKRRNEKSALMWFGQKAVYGPDRKMSAQVPAVDEMVFSDPDFKALDVGAPALEKKLSSLITSKPFTLQGKKRMQYVLPQFRIDDSAKNITVLTAELAAIKKHCKADLITIPAFINGIPHCRIYGIKNAVAQLSEPIKIEEVGALEKALAEFGFNAETTSVLNIFDDRDAIGGDRALLSTGITDAAIHVQTLNGVTLDTMMQGNRNRDADPSKIAAVRRAVIVDDVITKDNAIAKILRQTVEADKAHAEAYVASKTSAAKKAENEKVLDILTCQLLGLVDGKHKKSADGNGVLRDDFFKSASSFEIDEYFKAREFLRTNAGRENLSEIKKAYEKEREERVRKEREDQKREAREYCMKRMSVQNLRFTAQVRQIARFGEEQAVELKKLSSLMAAAQQSSSVNEELSNILKEVLQFKQKLDVEMARLINVDEVGEKARILLSELQENESVEIDIGILNVTCDARDRLLKSLESDFSKFKLEYGVSNIALSTKKLLEAYQKNAKEEKARALELKKQQEEKLVKEKLQKVKIFDDAKANLGNRIKLLKDIQKAFALLDEDQDFITSSAGKLKTLMVSASELSVEQVGDLGADYPAAILAAGLREEAITAAEFLNKCREFKDSFEGQSSKTGFAQFAKYLKEYKKGVWQINKKLQVAQSLLGGLDNIVSEDHKVGDVAQKLAQEVQRHNAEDLGKFTDGQVVVNIINPAKLIKTIFDIGYISLQDALNLLQTEEQKRVKVQKKRQQEAMGDLKRKVEALNERLDGLQNKLTAEKENEIRLMEAGGVVDDEGDQGSESGYMEVATGEQTDDENDDLLEDKGSGGLPSSKKRAGFRSVASFKTLPSQIVRLKAECATLLANIERVNNGGATSFSDGEASSLALLKGGHAALEKDTDAFAKTLADFELANIIGNIPDTQNVLLQKGKELQVKLSQIDKLKGEAAARIEALDASSQEMQSKFRALEASSQQMQEKHKGLDLSFVAELSRRDIGLREKISTLSVDVAAPLDYLEKVKTFNKGLAIFQEHFSKLSAESEALHAKGNEILQSAKKEVNDLQLGLLRLESKDFHSKAREFFADFLGFEESFGELLSRKGGDKSKDEKLEKALLLQISALQKELYAINAAKDAESLRLLEMAESLDAKLQTENDAAAVESGQEANRILLLARQQEEESQIKSDLAAKEASDLRLREEESRRLAVAAEEGQARRRMEEDTKAAAAVAAAELARKQRTKSQNAPQSRPKAETMTFLKPVTSFANKQFLKFLTSEVIDDFYSSSCSASTEPLEIHCGRFWQDSKTDEMPQINGSVMHFTNVNEAKNKESLSDYSKNPELGSVLLIGIESSEKSKEISFKIPPKSLLHASFRRLSFVEAKVEAKELPIFAQGVTLQKSLFHDCKFNGVDFSGIADFDGLTFRQCNFKNCKFPPGLDPKDIKESSPRKVGLLREIFTDSVCDGARIFPSASLTGGPSASLTRGFGVTRLMPSSKEAYASAA